MTERTKTAALLDRLEAQGYLVDLYKSATSSGCVLVRDEEIVKTFNRPSDALTWLDAKLDTLKERDAEADA